LSFVGGGQNNIAGGLETAIAAGAGNESCGSYNVIGGGFQNFLSDSSNRSFVGAGDNNNIDRTFSSNVSGSFIGAGYANGVDGSYAAVVAGYADEAYDAASFIGGGVENIAYSATSFIGAGNFNKTGGADAFVGAGTQNTAYALAFVGAGMNNIAGQSSFVGGGKQNEASGLGAFVGAGGTVAATGQTGQLNVAGGIDAFIGAGDGNAASAPESFIGAGLSNAIAATKAGGTSGAAHAFIGGGAGNLINPLVADGAQNAVIAGGQSNLVNGVDAAIGGGYKNVASGEYAVVPGGYENVAGGIGSFAAGTKAGALHNGTFVWSDGSSTGALNSSAPYQFIARAKGGFFLYSNAAATAGVELTPGSGTWASLSDRNMKRDIVPLDAATVLDRVATLPIDEWSYVSERGVRHVGPMAQDFYAAFNVGEDDRHISSIDESGVALAAIKALTAEKETLQATSAMLQSQDAALNAEVMTQRRGNARLRVRLNALEARVTALALASASHARDDNRSHPLIPVAFTSR
jgi:hypothetical protein